MYAQAEKKKDNKSRADANSVQHKKSNMKQQGFRFEDKLSKTLLQRKLQEKNDMETQNPHYVVNRQGTTSSFRLNELKASTVQLRGRKGKASAEPTPQKIKYSGYKKGADNKYSQDEVQKYLKDTANKRGNELINKENGSEEKKRYESITGYLNAIADYNDEGRPITNAEKNGGLCAGWVVLHRQNPDELIDMWEKIAGREGDDAFNDNDELDKAIETYMKAQYYFATDRDNSGEFNVPEEDVFIDKGFPSEKAQKSSCKNNKDRMVKYGCIYDTAYSFLDGRSSEEHTFIEIYDKAHTTQIEFQSKKVKSVCETEYGGIRSVNHPNEAERLLSSAFFAEKPSDPNETVTLSFEIYIKPKKKK